LWESASGGEEGGITLIPAFCIDRIDSLQVIGDMVYTIMGMIFSQERGHALERGIDHVSEARVG
jgi:hypothetical protein